MLEIFKLILLYPVVLLIAFLLHEFFHVKGQGITATGTIHVSKIGFTPSCNNINNVDWFFYSGGILSSIVLFAMCFFITNPVVSFCFWSNAWMQLVYGCYEGYNINGVGDRYYVYAIVLLLTTIIWWW